jgi:hypothetical protein
MVGGGAHGKDVGIDRGTMIQGGPTITKFHLFIDKYPQAGGMTTGSIIGKAINGTINEYLTKTLNRPGRPGKRVSIGRSKKVGVSRVINTKRVHSNTGRQVHNPEEANHSSTGNNNSSSTSNNNRDTMKEEKQGKMAADKIRTLPMPPIAGGIALGGGIVLLAVRRRKD